MVSEYISRDDAINAALAMDNLDCSMDVYLVRDMLKSVPSADVRPVVRGEWLFCKSTEDLMCSNCLHYWIPNGDQYDYYYCPNCGAEMEQEVKYG